MNNISQEVTVFVISVERGKNYTSCLEALKNQTVAFKLEQIQDVFPMSKAFQTMIDTCTTPYYIQVDEDMVLNPSAIETLYIAINNSSNKQAMICYNLKDVHLNQELQGIKIYKHSIFKNYSYIDTSACEMNQLHRLENDGYSYSIVHQVLGFHSPHWTTTNIYNRYYNLVERERKSPGRLSVLRNLWEKVKSNPDDLNLYALMGGLAALMTSQSSNTERNYLDSNRVELQLINSFLQKDPINYAPPRKKLKIVQLAEIPCANSGYELSNLLNSYSSLYESRYILCQEYCKSSEAIPYRKFPTDLFWQTNARECIEAIKNADIIHVHHDFDLSLIENYIKNKPLIYTLYAIAYHDVAQKSVYYPKIKKYSKIITIADQPLQKKVFADLSTYTIPLVNCLFNENIEKKNFIPKIVFAPTNRMRAGASKKMYYEVLDIIRKLKERGLKFEFILNEGLSHDDDLSRKREADIIIDDVDPEYEKWHNTSLHAACFGAIPLTNYSDNDYPFLKTNIYTLEQTLINLLSNYEYLKTEQRKISYWRQNFYSPEKLLAKYEELYKKCIS